MIVAQTCILRCTASTVQLYRIVPYCSVLQGWAVLYRTVLSLSDASVVRCGGGTGGGCGEGWVAHAAALLSLLCRRRVHDGLG